jgi:hypothetical protein
MPKDYEPFETARGHTVSDARHNSPNSRMNKARHIGGDLTGLKQYRKREPQDCRVSDEEALAGAIIKPEEKRVTVHVIAKYHQRAKIMEEQLYEVHMFIGKFLYEKRESLKKSSRHHGSKYNKGKTFTQWVEENESKLGMSLATIKRYIQGYEQFSLGIKPIPDMDSSDSTRLNVSQVNQPQTYTEQDVQTITNLEEILNNTPELTPDVEPTEVKPKGRLSKISAEHQLKLEWLKRHFKVKTDKEALEKAIDDSYTIRHDR